MADFKLHNGIRWEQIAPRKEDLNNHLQDYIRQPAFAITTGTNIAYTVTLTPPIPSYIDGLAITIVPHVDSGINPTLNVDGLGEVVLRNQEGKNMSLRANVPYTFRYLNNSFVSDRS
jgi:hypothetical protein